MARKKTHRHVGSDFEQFLREDKRLEAATALALKRVLAWKFQQAERQDLNSTNNRDFTRLHRPGRTIGCIAGAYAKGRLTKLTDPSGNTTYVYDGLGRVTSKRQTTNATPTSRQLSGYRISAA